MTSCLVVADGPKASVPLRNNVKCLPEWPEKKETWSLRRWQRRQGDSLSQCQLQFQAQTYFQTPTVKTSHENDPNNDDKYGYEQRKLVGTVQQHQEENEEEEEEEAAAAAAVVAIINPIFVSHLSGRTQSKNTHSLDVCQQDTGFSSTRITFSGPGRGSCRSKKLECFRHKFKLVEQSRGKLSTPTIRIITLMLATTFVILCRSNGATQQEIQPTTNAFKVDNHDASNALWSPDKTASSIGEKIVSSSLTLPYSSTSTNCSELHNEISTMPGLNGSFNDGLSMMKSASILRLPGGSNDYDDQQNEIEGVEIVEDSRDDALSGGSDDINYHYDDGNKMINSTSIQASHKPDLGSQYFYNPTDDQDDYNDYGTYIIYSNQSDTIYAKEVGGKAKPSGSELEQPLQRVFFAAPAIHRRPQTNGDQYQHIQPPPTIINHDSASKTANQNSFQAIKLNGSTMVRNCENGLCGDIQSGTRKRNSRTVLSSNQMTSIDRKSSLSMGPLPSFIEGNITIDERGSLSQLPFALHEPSRIDSLSTNNKTHNDNQTREKSGSDSGASNEAFSQRENHHSKQLADFVTPEAKAKTTTTITTMATKTIEILPLTSSKSVRIEPNGKVHDLDYNRGALGASNSTGTQSTSSLTNSPKGGLNDNDLRSLQQPPASGYSNDMAVHDGIITNMQQFKGGPQLLSNDQRKSRAIKARNSMPHSMESDDNVDSELNQDDVDWLNKINANSKTQANSHSSAVPLQQSLSNEIKRKHKQQLKLSSSSVDNSDKVINESNNANQSDDFGVVHHQYYGDDHKSAEISVDELTNFEDNSESFSHKATNLLNDRQLSKQQHQQQVLSSDNENPSSLLTWLKVMTNRLFAPSVHDAVSKSDQQYQFNSLSDIDNSSESNAHIESIPVLDKLSPGLNSELNAPFSEHLSKSKDVNPIGDDSLLKPDKDQAGQFSILHLTSKQDSNITSLETNKQMTHNVYYWRLIWFILPLGATFGNLLVILAVYRERSLQSVTNYFIVSLAFADLFVGTVVMPFAVYVLVNEVWELSDVLCDIFVAVDVTSSTASILNLVAISIDRYLAIAHPIAYSASSSSTRAILTIFMVWLISCCVGAPIILGLNTTPERQSTLCILYNSTFIFWSSLTSFYVPCIIMVVLYLRIFSAIRSRTKKVMIHHHNNLANKPTSKQLKTIGTDAVIKESAYNQDRIGQQLAITNGSCENQAPNSKVDEKQRVVINCVANSPSNGHSDSTMVGKTITRQTIQLQQQGDVQVLRRSSDQKRRMQSFEASSPEEKNMYPIESRTNGTSVNNEQRLTSNRLAESNKQGVEMDQDMENKTPNDSSNGQPNIVLSSQTESSQSEQSRYTNLSRLVDQEKEMSSKLHSKHSLTSEVLDSPQMVCRKNSRRVNLAKRAFNNKDRDSDDDDEDEDEDDDERSSEESDDNNNQQNGIAISDIESCNHQRNHHDEDVGCNDEFRASYLHKHHNHLLQHHHHCPSSRRYGRKDDGDEEEDDDDDEEEEEEEENSSSRSSMSYDCSLMVSNQNSCASRRHENHNRKQLGLHGVNQHQQRCCRHLIVSNCLVCEDHNNENQIEADFSCSLATPVHLQSTNGQSRKRSSLMSSTACCDSYATSTRCAGLSLTTSISFDCNSAIGTSRCTPGHCVYYDELEPNKLLDKHTHNCSDNSPSKSDHGCEETKSQEHGNGSNHMGAIGIIQSAGERIKRRSIRLTNILRGRLTSDDRQRESFGSGHQSSQHNSERAKRRHEHVFQINNCEILMNNSSTSNNNLHEEQDEVMIKETASINPSNRLDNIRDSNHVIQVDSNNPLLNQDNEEQELSLGRSKNLLENRCSLKPPHSPIELSTINGDKSTTVTSSTGRSITISDKSLGTNPCSLTPIATLDITKSADSIRRETSQTSRANSSIHLVSSVFNMMQVNRKLGNTSPDSYKPQLMHPITTSNKQIPTSKIISHGDPRINRQQQPQVHRGGGSRRRREKNAARRERKATKTLAIVLGIFLICWTPFFTCNIIDGICIRFEMDCRPGMIVYLITSWLGYINSCVNPIIYTIFNMEFRRAFKKILTTRPDCSCCFPCVN